jgi:hypothetical protein
MRAQLGEARELSNLIHPNLSAELLFLSLSALLLSALLLLGPFERSRSNPAQVGMLAVGNPEARLAAAAGDMTAGALRLQAE